MSDILKDGDRVRVVRKVPNQTGWHDYWVEAMDACLGNEGTVVSIDAENGPLVDMKGYGKWNFPPSSLQKLS